MSKTLKIHVAYEDVLRWDGPIPDQITTHLGYRDQCPICREQKEREKKSE